MIGEFDPVYSSNNIWWDEEFDQCLTLHLEDMKADISALENGKANTTHAHTGYATTDHTHDEYALTVHDHAGYANANHTHTDYADKVHTHTEYASEDHTHTGYATSIDIAQLQALITDLQNRIDVLEYAVNSKVYLVASN